MMHFFKRSEVHLDCFTYRTDVIEYAPVVNAIEVIPDWWRELPKSIIDNFSPAPTMKTCVGMSDYYTFRLNAFMLFYTFLSILG